LSRLIATYTMPVTAPARTAEANDTSMAGAC
jgi:hypothetical protein